MHKLSNVNPETGQAICSICGPTKIGRSRSSKKNGKIYYSCSTKTAESHIKWRKEKPDSYRKARTSAQLRYQRKKKYGVDEKQYQEMLEKQNCVCAICGLSSERTLAVDHCHTTGIIRGLLCMSCNTALGSFRDSKDLLFNAIEYLSACQQLG